MRKIGDNLCSLEAKAFHDYYFFFHSIIKQSLSVRHHGGGGGGEDILTSYLLYSFKDLR